MPRSRILMVGTTTRSKKTGYVIPEAEEGTPARYLFDLETAGRAVCMKGDRLYLWGTKGSSANGLFALGEVLQYDIEPDFNHPNDHDALIEVMIEKRLEKPVSREEAISRIPGLKPLLDRAIFNQLKLSKVEPNEAESLDALAQL